VLVALYPGPHSLEAKSRKKDQEEEALIRQVLIEQKAQHLEAVDPQNLGLDPNHHLGVWTRCL